MRDLPRIGGVMPKTIILIALAAAVGGCATQSYARLQPVTGTEAYSCAVIEAEIARAEGFRAEVSRGGERPWWAATSHIADLSTGNGRERREALRSADTRLAQLNNARAAQACSA